MVGRSLHHYEIVEVLGAGGMGHVYRARDARLDRDVALKMLPPDIAVDPERRRWFEREARAIAAIDHPGIVTIHSIEEARADDGSSIHFITMQLVEGEVLSECIRRHGLPLDVFFRIAVSLADAVGAAHDCGVVHRDLKPANIMVTPDQRARVLDFGLAELRQGPAPGGAPAADETSVTELDTEDRSDSGRIVGTVDYMSPEQIEGRSLDHRSDIFSLGVVLYEMATGQKPFRGESKVAVMSAILKDTPIPATELNDRLPRHLGRIIKLALDKDPEHRFQSAKDLRNELEELWSEIGSGELPLPGAEARERATGLPLQGWVLSATVALAIVLAAGTWSYLGGPDPLEVPPGTVPVTSLVGAEEDPAVSPDGDTVAFVWDGGAGGAFDLYLQLPGIGDPLRLTAGDAEVRRPAWSPDGREIAFLRRSGSGWSVLAVPALGGQERLLGSVGPVAFIGLDWAPDGRALAVVDRARDGDSESIYLLSTSDRQKRRLTRPPSSGMGDRDAAFSPDGRLVAFVRWYEAPRGDIYLVPADGGEASLLAVHEGWIRGLDWLTDGSGLVFSSRSATGHEGIWRVSLEGEVRPLPFGEDAWGLSVGGAGRLVYSRRFTDTNVWRVGGPAAVGDETPSRLIASTRDDWAPRYSPDGSRIALASDRSGETRVWICDAEGSSCSELRSEGLATAPRWSPDGTRLLFSTESSGNADFCVADLADGSIRCIGEPDATELAGGWSTDGRWIYYASDCTGEYQVWKVPADGGDAVQITRGTGLLPMQSADGRFVYYVKDTRPFEIWRLSEGGDETLVLRHPGLTVAGFTLWRHQLVYWLQDEERGPVVFRLDPDRDEQAEIVALGKDVRMGKYGRLSVSPDGRWIVYPRQEGGGSDLVLVDGIQ